MIVLHAIWDDALSHTLHIWAEASDVAASTTGRSKKTTGTEKARSHPYVLPHASLQEAVGDLVGSLLVKTAQAGTLSLRLPSTTKGPLSSPELLSEISATEQAAELKWWEVPTLGLQCEPGPGFFVSSAPGSSTCGRVWQLAALLEYSRAVRF